MVNWMLAALILANPFDKFDPASLMVMPPGQPAIVIDYATMERCQRARAEMLRQDHQNDADDKLLADRLGRAVVRQHVTAYCIRK